MGIIKSVRFRITRYIPPKLAWIIQDKKNTSNGKLSALPFALRGYLAREMFFFVRCEDSKKKLYLSQVQVNKPLVPATFTCQYISCQFQPSQTAKQCFIFSSKENPISTSESRNFVLGADRKFNQGNPWSWYCDFGGRCVRQSQHHAKMFPIFVSRFGPLPSPFRFQHRFPITGAGTTMAIIRPSFPTPTGGNITAERRFAIINALDTPDLDTAAPSRDPNTKTVSHLCTNLLQMERSN